MTQNSNLLFHHFGATFTFLSTRSITKLEAANFCNLTYLLERRRGTRATGAGRLRRASYVGQSQFAHSSSNYRAFRCPIRERLSLRASLSHNRPLLYTLILLFQSNPGSIPKKDRLGPPVLGEMFGERRKRTAESG